MTFLDLLAVVLFGFGTFAFGSIVVCAVAELRGQRIGPAEAVDVAITSACFVWFLVNTLLTLAPLRPDINAWPAWVLFLFICFLFPALIMNNAYTSGDPPLPERHLAWKLGIIVMYLVGLGIFGLYLATALNWIPLPRRLVPTVLNLSLPLLYITAAVYSMVLIAGARKPEQAPATRRRQRGHLLALGVMIVALIPMLLTAFTGVDYREWVSVLARSLPLFFLLSFSYHENRYHFFDVLVKTGAVMLLTLGVLAGAFALLLRWLEPLEAGWFEPWAYAIVLLPVGLALPWLTERMGEWIDYVWLGRRFTPEEAIKHFVSGLRGASSEGDLTARAERRLGAIFRAPVRVDLASREAPTDFESRIEIPLRIDDDGEGVIRLGGRENKMPYFSQDLTLAGSLAEILASLLQNARLQCGRREQEQRGEAEDGEAASPTEIV